MLEGLAREKTDVIPFEEFTKERANNFFIYFTPHEMAEMLYREKAGYQGLMKENPELAEKLKGAFAYMNDESAALDNAELAAQEERKWKVFDDNRKDLYEAYTIMRKYVKSDAELFS